MSRRRTEREEEGEKPGEERVGGGGGGGLKDSNMKQVGVGMLVTLLGVVNIGFMVSLRVPIFLDAKTNLLLHAKKFRSRNSIFFYNLVSFRDKKKREESSRYAHLGSIDLGFLNRKF